MSHLYNCNRKDKCFMVVNFPRWNTVIEDPQPKFIISGQTPELTFDTKRQVYKYEFYSDFDHPEETLDRIMNGFRIFEGMAKTYVEETGDTISTICILKAKDYFQNMCLSSSYGYLPGVVFLLRGTSLKPIVEHVAAHHTCMIYTEAYEKDKGEEEIDKRWRNQNEK